MPPVIPPPLAQYIHSSLFSPCPHSQTLITSVLSTPSPWLVLRFIYAALYGVEDGARGDGSDAGSRHEKMTTMTPPLPVVFASFLRPLTLWVEMGKKLGLDIPSLLRSRKMFYVDGLSYGSPPPVSVLGGGGEGADLALATTRLKSLALNDVQDALSAALKSVSTTMSSSASISRPPSGTPTPRMPTALTSSTQSPKAAKPFVLLDGIDFLVACQPFLSTLSVQAFLSSLRIQSDVLLLACNADPPLLHRATPTSEGTLLERNHAHLVTAMAHQSRWVLQLRGLDTGSAKDVSGVIRASKGGCYEGNEDGFDESSHSRAGNVDELDDAEWLYQLKGDGSARVWGRGE
ncbi:uncharacterized protein Z519_08986 [Cladophialophora bantiana CBS 173.52]|uniref:Elongator complex protein 5 n=1 Tax=Cladophialophora bantiana (strain ATCC 10958 / CBS 173.52 / CDC B-1940 / NIH 8579) TaxID=1442370 RepID=A0A0D2FUX0_CLAB1|nr:uncharacterized protein Z519_08986 [Cladophialophora bantiana CBS 173.52]KIW90342.1 hypothetical protein Z519_08986 [Cladophialophora bantiana CBS 173.52]